MKRRAAGQVGDDGTWKLGRKPRWSGESSYGYRSCYMRLLVLWEGERASFVGRGSVIGVIAPFRFSRSLARALSRSRRLKGLFKTSPESCTPRHSNLRRLPLRNGLVRFRACQGRSARRAPGPPGPEPPHQARGHPGGPPDLARSASRRPRRRQGPRCAASSRLAPVNRLELTRPRVSCSRRPRRDREASRGRRSRRRTHVHDQRPLCRGAEAPSRARPGPPEGTGAGRAQADDRQGRGRRRGGRGEGQGAVRRGQVEGQEAREGGCGQVAAGQEGGRQGLGGGQEGRQGVCEQGRTRGQEGCASTSTSFRSFASLTP